MLRPDLIEAVKKGDFHVYAVKTIDEGIEILTGKKAGVKTATGRYTKGSINDLVDEKLKSLAMGLKEFGDDKKKKGAKKTTKKGSAGTDKKKDA